MDALIVSNQLTLLNSEDVLSYLLIVIIITILIIIIIIIMIIIINCLFTVDIGHCLLSDHLNPPVIIWQ